MARAEFVAFLTQDALPLDDMWLHNLVCVLKAYPHAGGVFGRHVAYEDATEFVQRDIRRHFDQFDALPVCIDLSDSWVRQQFANLSMKQLFHFYSDNNSCLRTAAWRSVAIPNLDFGEDQAFAFELLTHGYGKAYARNAAVYHSHDYPPDVAEQRAYEEARFFNRQFGYSFPASEIEIQLAVDGVNLYDTQWAKEHRIPDEQLGARIAQNKARVHGWARAMREAQSAVSKN
jgi:GT2 family glycosyltransferase